MEYTLDDFVEDVARDTSLDDKFSSLVRYLERFGFPYCIIGERFPHQAVEPTPNLLHCVWDPEWFEIYSNEQYWKVDPYQDRGRRERRPFLYIPDQPVSREQAKFFAHAQDYGANIGFGVPFHYASGRMVGLSISGGERLPDRLNLQKMVAAIVLFEMDMRAHRIVDARQETGFSKKQIERLAKYRAGWRYANIAAFDGVEADTVAKSFQRMRDKAGVRTTRELMDWAVACGLLEDCPTF